MLASGVSIVVNVATLAIVAVMDAPFGDKLCHLFSTCENPPHSGDLNYFFNYEHEER